MLHPEVSPPSFPAHARTVVRSIRVALSELLLAMGADPHDPQTVHQRGVTRTLAWKICKIVQAEDPSLVFEHMPGASGIDLLLGAAQRAGAEPARVENVRRAVSEYERLIDLHCGDRATLEMMGAELSPGGRRQRDEYHRKLLFQGASYVWGVQARVLLKIGIVGPGHEDGLLDFLSLNGVVDFRRLRPDVKWVMATRRAKHDDHTSMKPFAYEAIDPAFSSFDRAPMVSEFCSQPLPEFRRIDDALTTSFELTEGRVGNTGAMTCVFGAIHRNIPYYRTPTNEMGEHRAQCDVPAELLVLDLFLHESLAFAIPPQVGLLSDVRGGGDPHGSRYEIPLSEPLQDLGVGPVPPATPEVPQYRRMVQTSFERMGWKAEEFHGFRMKMLYPAYPTAVVLRYALPDAPAV